MDIFVKKFQPEKYQDWISGKDIAPHPEDPPGIAVIKFLIQGESENWKHLKTGHFEVFIFIFY